MGDRFSQARFSQRQHDVAARNRSRQVYTPQLILDGRTLRAGTLPDDLDDRLRSINAEPAGATIRAESRAPAERLSRSTSTRKFSRQQPGVNADVWLAAFENGLSSAVARGENAGVLLNHDFVVRDLVGPFPDPERRPQARRAAYRNRARIGTCGAPASRSSCRIETLVTVLQATAMFPICQP